MDHWQALDNEFDAWAAVGKTADLWWRDDDAINAGPQLNRLVKMTETTGLLLAVIPLKAQSALAEVVRDAAHVKVAQHGYAHLNHAPRGQGLGAWELGLHRGDAAVLNELDHGRQLLEAMFKDDYICVIVPPWNRVDPMLLAPIAERGFLGVSRFGPRECAAPYKNFQQVNSHCDPIRWKGGAAFKGEAKTLGNLVEHLRARRNGLVDATEATGYLTHHIDLDESGWAFSEQLVQRVNRHEAARWCRDVGALFHGGDE